MSAPTPAAVSTLRKFMVYAPDNTEAGTFEKRLLARPKHGEIVKARHADGSIRAAGWLGNPEPEAEQKMVGSLFIFEADSIEQVEQMVKTDQYYTAGVWDVEKIVILPFSQVYGTPI